MPTSSSAGEPNPGGEPDPRDRRTAARAAARAVEGEEAMTQTLTPVTATKLAGETLPSSPSFLTYTLREPLGVVGAIIPWNFPMNMVGWKAAPALAAGNTVILKPAELTPLTAIRIGELALEAGLPPGVL